MELNREQVIEILERFDFFQGQRAGRELWTEKPFEVQEEDLKNFSKDVASLKAFIKELTEENERLRGCVMSEEEVMDIANEVIKQGTSIIKADTVRELQNRLTREIGTYLSISIIKVADMFKLIDQIAKEMMEGEG